MVLVSVIIPCYNCERWVRRAVNSVLSQSYKNIELILVDNNSTDSTLQILNNLKEEYSGRVRVYSEKKKGACAARNLGLAHANGDWIQFLDADDELLPNKIEHQMAAVAAEGPDVVISDYYSVTEYKSKLRFAKIIAEEDPWIGLIDSKLGITSANLFRKDKLLRVNGWDEELTSCQEYDLMFRLSMIKAKFSVKHSLQTNVYKQAESISRTKDNQKRLEILRNRYLLKHRICNHLESSGKLNKTYKTYAYSAIFYHLMLIKEVDTAVFKNEIAKFHFYDLGMTNKTKVLFNYIRHSTHRKFGDSNFLFKTVEWLFFVCKNSPLLRY